MAGDIGDIEMRKFRLEVINSCCFQHEEADVVNKYKYLKTAVHYAKKLEDMTMNEQESKYTEEAFNITGMFTALRIVEELDARPFEIIKRNRQTRKYLYEYKDDEKMSWVNV